MFSSWKLFKTANPETDLDASLAITLMRISQAVKWAMGESLRVHPVNRLNGSNHWPERVSGNFGIRRAVPGCAVCTTCENSVCYMSSG